MMDASGQNAASVPYIGSKISLISNVDIRYEGILYSINTFESTVALQNVRSFGTEGRRTPDIPPNNKTYQFIIFKGKDIKDLTVCETSSGRIPDDPAVVSVNVPPSASASGVPPVGAQNQMRTVPSHMGGHRGVNDAAAQADYGPGRMYSMGGQPPSFPAGAHGMPTRMPTYPQQMGPQNGGPGGAMQLMRPHQGPGLFGFGVGRGGADMYHQRQRGSFGMGLTAGDTEVMMQRGVPGRGGRFGRGGGRGRGDGTRRIVGELSPQPNHAMKKEVSRAFDFESANEKFDKTQVKNDVAAAKAEGENGTTEKSARGGYNKSTSFFDHISCETLDRASGQETRIDREKQRQLDCETFGAAAAASRGRNYRRDYRRGGGGRRGGGQLDYGRPRPNYTSMNYMPPAGYGGVVY